jgi:CheY-like chemotaxis protein
VLVVDNNVPVRKRHAELLGMWGYQPFVAEGVADALIADAIHKARAHRCQLALVDMHLCDDYDRRDWSGLQLVPRLKPAVSIIVSASGSRNAVVAALKEFDAFSFVGKDDGPEQLQATIEQAVQSIACGPNRAWITWSDGLTSSAIREALLPEQPDVPADAADDVIRRLFAGARHVTLTMLPARSDTSSHVSSLRRKSRVFRAIVDEHLAAQVVKLTRVDKIEDELRRYKEYVQLSLPTMYRPEKFAQALFWDLGAIAYSYVGNSDISSANGPQTFTNFYHTMAQADQIVMPLAHFFDETNWGVYYTFGVAPLDQPLFDAYDRAWQQALSAQFGSWAARPPTLAFPDLPALPDARRWIVDHRHRCQEVDRPRQAVTHGDLHGDNMFVDRDRAWPIDFERTGPGPILRDFVELIQDILTRIARFEERDLPVFYELAMTICAPRRPDEPMRLTKAIRSHPEAHKAFELTQQIQQLAYKHTHYTDQREYLWSLLLNCLFVVRRLPDANPRCVRTLVLAGVICRRLARMRSRKLGRLFATKATGASM